MAIVRAVYLSSTSDDNANVMQELHHYSLDNEGMDSEIKLLYVTPERFKRSDQFRRVLGELVRKNCISRFVIDEAHCLSQVRLLWTLKLII
jgi:ATP-dependent DNA helicase Q1